MEGSPYRAVNGFVGTLSALALVALVATAALAQRVAQPPLLLVGLGAGIAFAFFLVTRYGSSLVMDVAGERSVIAFEEVVVFAAVLLLPPPVAVLAIFPGSVLDQVVARRRPVKAFFNVANAVLATSLCALVAASLQTAGAPSWFAALPATFLFPYFIEVMLARVFTLLDGVPWRAGITRQAMANAATTGTVSTVLGVTAVGLWALHPALVLLLAPALFLVRRHLRLTNLAQRESRAYRTMAASERNLVGVSDEDQVAKEILRVGLEIFSAGRVEVVFAQDGGRALPPRSWRLERAEGVHGSLAPITQPIGRGGSITLTPGAAASDGYAAEDVALLGLLAAYATLALENASALRQIDARSRREAALARFSQTALATREVAELTAAADALCVEVLGHAMSATVTAPGDAEFVERVAYIVTTATHRVQTERALREGEKLSALGTLVAGVAHEINNPLTYMRGTVELSQEELREKLKLPGASEELRSSLSQIAADQDIVLRGIDRIADITRSLKRVGRRAQTGRAPDDLNAIARSVAIVAHSRLSAETEIVQVLGSRSRVVVNGGEIAQVVLNLVLNAADALRDKGGTITIETSEDEQACTIEVRDDGPGIPPDVQTKLFTPFFTTKLEGTGLGLSLSRRIVEDHEGSLTFESQPGRGTTFRVRLPRSSVPPRTPPPQPPAERPFP